MPALNHNGSELDQLSPWRKTDSETIIACDYRLDDVSPHKY